MSDWTCSIIRVILSTYIQTFIVYVGTYVRKKKIAKKGRTRTYVSTVNDDKKST